MNEFSLATRRTRDSADDPHPSEIPSPGAPPTVVKPAPPRLAELSRDELLREGLYDPAAAPDTLDDEQLRQEVRWRRAAILREPAFTALARLLSKVSPHSFDELSQGDLSPAQLIEAANGFISGQDGVKVLKIPDRVEDHERRLTNLESSTD